MSQFIFTSHVTSTYKKAYKQHYDKLYPLYKSKEVEIEDNIYVLVGQWRLKEYPLLSDFDIFDENGISAGESIGQMIHSYIGKITMTKNTLSNLQDPFTKQLEETILPARIKEAFAIKDEEIALLTKSLNMANKTLNVLIDLVNTLLKKEQWDENDIITLEGKWNNFLYEYKPRACVLLDVCKQNLKQKRENAYFENKLVNSLWEEAEIIYDAYKLFSPLGASVGRFTVEELIKHNYQYGRFRQNDNPMERTNKLGRALYWFVLYFYRFSVWVFIPFMFYALWLDDSLTFVSALSIILFGIIGFNVKSLNKYHVLGKVNAAIAEHRSVVNHNEAGSSDLINRGQEETDPLATGTSTTLYETKVFVYHIMYTIVLFLFVFTIAPIFAYFTTEDVGVRWVIYPLLIGFIVILTMIYPFQIFSWKRFVLKGTSINIGSRRFGVSEIREMRLLSDKKLIYIYVTYTDNPFKLRVDKRNYKGLIEALDMFCTRYDIPFKEQW